MGSESAAVCRHLSGALELSTFEIHVQGVRGADPWHEYNSYATAGHGCLSLEQLTRLLHTWLPTSLAGRPATALLNLRRMLAAAATQFGPACGDDKVTWVQVRIHLGSLRRTYDTQCYTSRFSTITVIYVCSVTSMY